MGLSLVQQHIFHYFNLVKVASLTSTLETFEEIIQQLNLNKISNETDLRSEISSVNETIKNYDLEVIESTDEISSEKLFVLINTGDNIMTQKAKFYDESTIQAFSKIIKECIISEKGYVSETHCLNLSSQIGITKTVAQSVIEKLIKDKWLVVMNGNVSLGMRSIVELEQNIKQQYPDEIKHCPFCKLIVVQGYICGDCKIRCHFACLSRYHTLAKNCVCPNCKQTWENVPAVINKLRNSNLEDEEETEEEVEESMSTVPTKKKRKD